METPKTQAQEKIICRLTEDQSEFSEDASLPSMPEEQIQERIVEETDIPVPHMMEKTVEVMKPVPQERVQNNTVEHIVDMPVSQIQDETVEVIQLLPQDRMSDHVVEQIVDAHRRQIREHTDEVEQAFLATAHAGQRDPERVCSGEAHQQVRPDCHHEQEWMLVADST